MQCDACGHDPDDTLIVTDEMLANGARRRLLKRIEGEGDAGMSAKELAGIVQQSMKNDELRLLVKLKSKDEGNGVDDLASKAAKARQLQGDGQTKPRRQTPVGAEAGGES